MNIRKVDASRGRAWVGDGARLFRRAPLPLMVITMTYLMLLVLCALIPLAGAIAPLVATPILAVGMMQAVRMADQGRTPVPSALFDGFRKNTDPGWKGLLVLGAINATLTVLALGLSSLLDGGTLFELATGQIAPTDDRLRSPALLGSMLLFTLIYTPLQMGQWYAPLFVAWHGVPPVKALFFSIVACWRNRWAFLQFGLAWMMLMVIVSIVMQLVAALLGGSIQVLQMLLLPVSLVLLALLYCSFWPTYRDVVEES